VARLDDEPVANAAARARFLLRLLLGSAAGSARIAFASGLERGRKRVRDLRDESVGANDCWSLDADDDDDADDDEGVLNT
jgi:hypothetical protein